MALPRKTYFVNLSDADFSLLIYMCFIVCVCGGGRGVVKRGSGIIHKFIILIHLKNQEIVEVHND
jgi:hypothetical protein